MGGNAQNLIDNLEINFLVVYWIGVQSLACVLVCPPYVKCLANYGRCVDADPLDLGDHVQRARDPWCWADPRLNGDPELLCASKQH